MKNKRVAWLKEDEEKNIRKYGLSFSQANEVINNELTLKVRNVHNDYTFIGFTDDLIEVLYVYCINDQSIRRVISIRKATMNEKNALFLKIAGAENETT